MKYRNVVWAMEWRTCSPRRSATAAEDYGDVFGGPPRTLLFSPHFYDQIFRPPETSRPSNGRSLPPFNIPTFNHGEEFYDDIFGWEKEKPLKTTSSDEEEKEEEEEDASSSLRPINVRSKRSFKFGSCRKNASPETISLEPMSNCSLRVSADDLEPNSPPPSPVKKLVEEEEEEEDIMSCYTIEIKPDHRDNTTSEPNAIDEAIAWAKQKTLSPKKHFSHTASSKVVSEINSDALESSDEDNRQQENEKTLGQREMRILDDKIRLWSDGKERDIRLLLCTLHHIIWPNSGWLPIPLHNLIEIPKVKKGYQRARLCLHPDKLQQRGATPPQKYLAENAFSILQDAWSEFISMAVL